MTALNAPAVRSALRSGPRTRKRADILPDVSMTMPTPGAYACGAAPVRLRLGWNRRCGGDGATGPREAEASWLILGNPPGISPGTGACPQPLHMTGVARDHLLWGRKEQVLSSARKGRTRAGRDLPRLRAGTGGASFCCSCQSPPGGVRHRFARSTGVPEAARPRKPGRWRRDAAKPLRSTGRGRWSAIQRGRDRKSFMSSRLKVLISGLQKTIGRISPPRI